MAQDYLAAYGPERAAFIVRHALEAAKMVDFPIQTFGGTKNFLPQALAAWDKHVEIEDAIHEAETRVDEQLCREEEARDHRQRLAEIRAALPADTLASLKRRTEAALAADGVDRTRLRYEVLVKLKMDELLEQEEVPLPASPDGAHPAVAVTAGP